MVLLGEELALGLENVGLLDQFPNLRSAAGLDFFLCVRVDCLDYSRIEGF